MENELEVVNIRLVKEPSLYSEQTLDNPQAVVELMAKELSQYDREVFCIHHAQLIFNTHNPIFLNSNLFRRDEIKFVERDDVPMTVYYMHYLILAQQVIRVFVSTKII